jgi:hypothetical protein
MSRGWIPGLGLNLDALKEAFLRNASAGCSASAVRTTDLTDLRGASPAGSEFGETAPQPRETHKPDTDRAQGRR